jgi:DNA invertase Pin-like site-specific DNA recombinase
MLIGYSRISTSEQNLEAQNILLREKGCEKIYSEIVSGKDIERKELNRLLNYIREEDSLVVVKLDRLGRSLQDLIAIMKTLEKRNINFISLTEGMDTSTSTGKLLFHIFGAIAEFERDLIIERTYIGLAAARARGRKGGRSFKMNLQKAREIRELLDTNKFSIEDVCIKYRISKSSMYRWLKNLREEESKK